MAWRFRVGFQSSKHRELPAPRANELDVLHAAGGEVVDYADPVPLLEERLGEVRADETGARP